MSNGFQVREHAGPAYEELLVPRIFAPCADQLLELAAVAAGERVLDVACGTGIVARRAAARVGDHGSVVGVDVNEVMLAVAAAATKADARAEWRLGDAAALPVADGSFDVVCCQQGLQYVAEPPLALVEARRALVPGGRLALAVWRALDHHPVFELLVHALERHAGVRTADLMRRPFSGPGRETLRRLLHDAGFTRPRAGTGVIAARFPSPLEFLRIQVAASPLAEPVGALAEDRRVALEAEVEDVLQPFVDDEGLVVLLQTWLIRASRA
jgi:ubiquinone/menaquinone biosynthesis C-methylase UbiE